MRNGRGPRTILRFIAIIAMNLFTINCACYIAVTVSAHADPRLLHLSRTVGTLCGMMAIAITPILLITVLVNGMEEGKKRHEENNDGAGRGICRPTQRHPAEHKRGREHAGLAEAYNRLAQVMDELCIPMREEEVLEPISHEEACETAERLYRQLIEQAKDHTTIRLAQAMNRAWAELTVVEGLDRLARPQSKDE